MTAKMEGRRSQYFTRFKSGLPLELDCARRTAAFLRKEKKRQWGFDWNLALAKFVTQVVAYLAPLTDTYPSIDEEQVVELSIPYPNAKTELSQWMSLVKYFLAIPHYIFLGFLDVVTVIIIVAWLAILFGGRYPKNLFDFVVGVFRWHLRVAAYMLLLTTDEYPPFTIR